MCLCLVGNWLYFILNSDILIFMWSELSGCHLERWVLAMLHQTPLYYCLSFSWESRQPHSQVRAAWIVSYNHNSFIPFSFSVLQNIIILLARLGADSWQVVYPVFPISLDFFFLETISTFTSYIAGWRNIAFIALGSVSDTASLEFLLSWRQHINLLTVARVKNLYKVSGQCPYDVCVVSVITISLFRRMEDLFWSLCYRIVIIKLSGKCSF